MAKIFKFPEFDPETRQHYTEVKEELVEQGIFHDPAKIPPGLIYFIIEWWGTVYEAGKADGDARFLILPLTWWEGRGEAEKKWP